MIEIAANGALFEELAAVRALNTTREPPIRLHVIRPRFPLPLDPDLLLGRVDAATLIAMGHRDACHYLEGRLPEGVALGPESTRMEDPRPGVAFRETLCGDLGGVLTVRLGWEIEDLERFAIEGSGSLVGDASHPSLGERVLACGGTLRRAGREWQAELRLPGASLHLARTERNWNTVRAQLVDERGVKIAHGRLVPVGRPAWQTLHARGVGSMAEGGRALSRFARIVLGRWSPAPGPSPSR
jgi:hypothetical protein